MLELKLQKFVKEILSENFTDETFYNLSDHEWSTIFDFSKKQNLHIIIYSLLKQHKVSIPHAIESEMKKNYYAACAKSYRREDQIKEIIKLFNDNGIEHILLKGAHLVSSVYEKPFTRITNDIDILVKHDDSVSAYNLLLENGYKGLIFSEKEHENFKKDNSLKHYVLQNKKGCLLVEIHIFLSTKYKTNLNGIWERSKKVNLNGLETRIMCSEDLIMHISMHKFLEDCAVNGLLGVYDICNIIGNDSINWKTLKKLTSADEYNNTKCLYIALKLSRDMMKCKIDDRFLKMIQPDSYYEKTEYLLKELMFCDYYEFDKDVFLVRQNIYGISFFIKSDFLKKLFLNPLKMAIYGKVMYGKYYPKPFNLRKLYIRRTITLIKRYSSAGIKNLFLSKKFRYSIEIGKIHAEYKYWVRS